MRNFTVGDGWGPFPCEHPGCTKTEVYTIRLTDAESRSLPEDSGPRAAAFIFYNKLGVADCGGHS